MHAVLSHAAHNHIKVLLDKCRWTWAPAPSSDATRSVFSQHPCICATHTCPPVYAQAAAGKPSIKVLLDAGSSAFVRCSRLDQVRVSVNIPPCAHLCAQAAAGKPRIRVLLDTGSSGLFLEEKLYQQYRTALTDALMKGGALRVKVGGRGWVERIRFFSPESSCVALPGGYNLFCPIGWLIPAGGACQRVPVCVLQEPYRSC